jgi:ABC-type nitrate/sulfonate/bicarbonate transport system substrate-binding protein
MGTIVSTNVVNLGFTGNTNVSVIASIDTNNANGIVGRKSAGINVPEDSRGRKIAFNPATSAEIFLVRFLEKYNLTGDVELVKMQTNTISTALVSKSVDAICSFGSFLYNSEKAMDGDVTFFREEDFHDMYLGLNKDYISKNRDTVQKVIKALKKAEAFTESNTADAQEIAAQIVNLELDLVQNTWTLHYYSIILNTESKDRVISIGEYYKNDNANKGKPFPDYSIYFDYSFMEESD